MKVFCEAELPQRVNNKCCLCGEPCARFARSHLIPWGFLKRGEHANDMSLLSSVQRMKRLRKGLYDEHILCDDCEHRYFYAPDTYAIQVFRDLNGAARVDKVAADGRSCVYYVYEKIDRRLLRAFFASVLWRCSVSKHESTSGINLGRKYEGIIARDLQNAGAFDYVDATCVRFDVSSQDKIIGGLNSGFAMPERTRFQYANRTANGYNIYLPGLKFCVSLDQRANPFSRMDDELAALDPSFQDASISISKAVDGKRYLQFVSGYPSSLAQKIAAVCRNQHGRNARAI